MNPTHEQIAAAASARQRENEKEAARRAELHTKAVARRRKAKRGGKR